MSIIHHRQIFWCCHVSLVKFSDWSMFHVNTITGSGVWQFLYLKDWPDIWKLETPPSEFCPITGDCDKFGLSNLAVMSLMKCYWMLQNTRATSFTVSELQGENQQSEVTGGRGGLKLPQPLSFRFFSTLKVKRILQYLSMFFLIFWYFCFFLFLCIFLIHVG